MNEYKSIIVEDNFNTTEYCVAHAHDVNEDYLRHQLLSSGLDTDSVKSVIVQKIVSEDEEFFYVGFCDELSSEMGTVYLDRYNNVSSKYLDDFLDCFNVEMLNLQEYDDSTSIIINNV